MMCPQIYLSDSKTESEIFSASSKQLELSTLLNIVYSKRCSAQFLYFLYTKILFRNICGGAIKPVIWVRHGFSVKQQDSVVKK